MATYFTDDFADFSTCSAGNCGDWTERWNAGYWAVASGDITLNAGKANDFTAVTWDDLDGDANRDNIELLIKMTLSSATNTTERAFCVVRGGGADEAETGYFLGVSTDNLRILYQDGTASSAPILKAASAQTLTASTTYWFRIRVNSTTLQARFWADGGSEGGTWMVDTTGSEVTGTGFAGLAIYGSSMPNHVIHQIGVGTNGDTAPAAASGGSTTLTAASGSFALTGNATSLATARKMAASAVSFSLTGVTTGLFRAFTLGAETAVYTLTGVTAGLKADRTLTASTGSYSFTGNAVNLIYATAGTITAGTGTFSLTGVATGLTVTRKLTTTTGSFAITGNTTGLAIGRSLPAITGTYTLTGIDAALTAAIAKRLACDTGSFVISGKAVDLVLDTGRQGDGTITKQGIASKKIAKVKSKEQLKLERIFGREEEPSELVARLLEPVVDIPADIKQEVKGKDSVSKAKVIVAYAEVYKETLKAVERKKVDQILMAYEESMQKRMILRRQEEELLLLMTF